MASRTLVTAFQLVCFVWLVKGQSCPQQSGFYQYGDYCLRFYTDASVDTKNYEEAQEVCNSINESLPVGGKLVLIDTQDKQETIKSYLHNSDRTDRTFIQGNEHTTPEKYFYWAKDDPTMTYMCYYDPYEDTLRVNLGTFKNLNIQVCSSKCFANSASFKYVGVRYNDQDEVECFCGEEIQNNRGTAQCDRTCPGIYQDSTCGNYNRALYFRAQYGDYDEAKYQQFFRTNQPNDFDGYQRCVVIDHQDNFKWNDELCSNTYGSVCELPMSESACTDESQAYTRRKYVAGKCVYISSDRVNFYSAQYQVCPQAYSGGQLIKIDNMNLQQEVVSLIPDRNLRYWIGFVGSRFVTDADRPMRYFNFANEQPHRLEYKCLGISRNAGVGDSYKWEDFNCNERRHFICEWALSPPTTSVSTTTTTTPPSTTTTTPTTTTTTVPVVSTSTPHVGTPSTPSPSTPSTPSRSTPSTPTTVLPRVTTREPISTTTREEVSVTPTKEEEEEEMLATGVIVAIAVAAVAVLVGVIRLVVYCCQRSSSGYKTENMLENGGYEYENSGMVHDENAKNESTLPGSNRNSAISDMAENDDMTYAY